MFLFFAECIKKVCGEYHNIHKMTWLSLEYYQLFIENTLFYFIFIFNATLYMYM